MRDRSLVWGAAFGLMLLAAGAARAQVDEAPDIKSMNVSGAPVLHLDNPDLKVAGGWAPAPDKPGDVPGYLTIDNRGGDDELVGATCTNAQGTTLNETNPKRPDDPGLAPMGTASNPILEQIAVPARSRLVLKPGGLHLVMQDLATLPRPGETIGCLLTFQNAGPIDVSLKVIDQQTASAEAKAPR